MATYYWRGGSGTWDPASTTNWSTAPGGAGGAGPPGAGDDVVFNSASSGVSYVVTCNNGICQNITTTAPATGTLTFENDGLNTLFTAYGPTVNIHGACIFNCTISTNFLRMQHQYFGATPVTVTFNSSGTNTQKLAYNGTFGPSVTFCNAQTCTFSNVQIFGAAGGTFTCTGSNITLATPTSVTGSIIDTFYIRYFDTINVGTTTFTFGTTSTSTVSTAELYLSANITLTSSTTNVVHARPYDYMNLYVAELNNVTLRSTASPGNNVQFAYMYKINGTFTLWDGNLYWNNLGTLTFTGAFALNAGTINFLNPSFSTVTFSSTVTTTTVGSTSTATPSLNFTTAYITSITFNGAVAFNGAGCAHYFYSNNSVPSINFNSTLTATISSNSFGQAYFDNSYSAPQTVTCAGNVSLTNLQILGGANWVQTGTTTLATTTNPTTLSSNFNCYSLSMGTGAISFTSTNVNITGNIPATSTSLNSSALVTVNGSSTTAGVTFSASNAVSFPAATLATWTDVSLSLGGTFTVTGAGGFTLAGAAKNSSITASNTRMVVTGPIILNIGALAAEKTVRIESIAASSTLTINGLTGAVASFQTTGNNGNNNTVTGAASFTNLNFFTTSNPSTTFSSTFGWTSTLANNNYIEVNGTFTFVGAATIANPSTLVFYGDIVCNANFAISATSLIDNKSSGVTVAVTGFTSTNAASTTTFTNARVAISTASIAGAVTLATNGGMYIYGGTATISGALTSSGAGTFFPIEGEVGTTLALNGAVTLVNANVKVPTITVAGGATKNFAYSLSSPIADNRSGYGRVFYNYPEIAFDTFTLTNTGGTFSVAGGGAANLRTFISPYSYTTATSAAMNLAVNPSFTDVDFWRIVPGGASTKPWTGTRLGNVGTLTNITFTAPKAVYFVGGAGSWGGAKWATSSGGVGAVANYPLPQDTIYFDSNSGVGDVTLPASVRFKDISVLSLAAGTLAIYSASPSATSQVYTNMFMSGSFFGPSTPTVGTFIFGNDTTYSYYFSYNLSPLIAQINLIVADSSSSDLHTLAPQNVQFMPNTMLQFASLGTTTVTTDIANSSGYELAGIGAYTEGDYATRAVNFTCARVGRITTSTDWGLGSSAYSFGYGAFNFGSCALGAATISLSSNVTIANTAYTVIVSYSLTMTDTANPNAGNVIFRLGTGTLNSINFYNGGSSGSFYKNLSTYGANASSVIYFYNVSGNGFNCASFTANAAITLRNTSSNTTLTKTGGGTVSLPGVKVTPTGNRINASPANTWYVPGGTVGSGSTGWSTTSPSGSNTGGFFMF